MTSICEYASYWKLRFEYFPLGTYATFNFMWIISFEKIEQSVIKFKFTLDVLQTVFKVRKGMIRVFSPDLGFL